MAEPAIAMDPPDADLDTGAHALAEATRIAEALIFASAEPVEEKEIGKRMPEGVKAAEALQALTKGKPDLVLTDLEHHLFLQTISLK
mgnify:CR=1 FL=1